MSTKCKDTSRVLQKRDDLVRVMTDRCLDGLYLAKGEILEYCFSRDGIVFLESPSRRDYVRLDPEDIRYVATLADALVRIGEHVLLEVGARPSESKFRELSEAVEAEARHLLNRRSIKFKTASKPRFSQRAVQKLAAQIGQDGTQ